jgi:hypothetical protein
MLFRLAYFTFVIGYGSTGFGLTIVAAGVVATIVLLIRRCRASQPASAEATRLILVLASALVMPAWSLVFVNHTLLHAVWMVRPFGWYAGLAALLALWPKAA